jgi:cytochrome c oxidase assembly factor CtaG
VRISLFFTHWHGAASLDAQLSLVAVIYLVATTRTRWPVRRTLSFLSGLTCVLVALQSGLDTLDDQLLSVHMAQHLLLLMVAPLLLLGGQPVLLALRVLPRRGRRVLARALVRLRPLTGPVSCLAVFTAVVLLTHLPGFYDATLRHPGLHVAEHLAYLIAGLLLWWPITDTDPAPGRRLGGLGRLVYVLAAMPAMALLGAYLNRATVLFYPAYGPPARALGISAVADQQHAGAIMWVGGSMIVTVVGLWVAVAALLADERRQRRSDAHALAHPGGQVR